MDLDPPPTGWAGGAPGSASGLVQEALVDLQLFKAPEAGGGGGWFWIPGNAKGIYGGSGGSGIVLIAYPS